MILAVGVMALVSVLATVGTTLSTRDLHGSSQAQQAGSALDAAEAGIAHAISYIRRSGTRKLSCYPANCTTNPWNPTNPVTADARGASWTAYIKPESIGNGAAGDRYVIRSTGRAGGPAERTVEVEVTVAPIGLPKGIFARTINLGGTVDLEQISIFTTGCVYKRDKVRALYSAGLDAAYNLPIGVHSSQIITESQGSGQYCSNTSRPIHGGLNLAGLSLLPCNSTYPYDQDRFGGSLTELPLLGGLTSLLPCASASTLPAYAPRDIDLNGTLDVNGSFIRDDKSLFRSFGITRPALSAAQIEQLKITAQAQGSYYTSPTGWTVPNGNENPHTVLFFDLTSNQTVDLKPLDGSLWSRGRVTDALSPLCIDASLVVIIQGGNARLNGDSPLAASVYLAGAAPGGQLFKSNGTADHIGMLYADTIDMTGDLGVSLDTCFIANPPPSLFDITTGTYRELDR